MRPKRPNSRERLLGAGLRLLHTRRDQPIWRAVTAAEVTEAANVTRATFYLFWRSTDEFLKDLLEYATDHYDAVDRIQHTISTTTPEEPLRAVVVRAAREAAEHLGDSPILRLHLLLWGEREHDPRLKKAAAEFDERLSQQFARIYEMLAEQKGYEFRPPFQPSEVARALDALTLGLAIQRSASREAISDELFAKMLVALVAALGRKKGADDRDFDEFVAASGMDDGSS